MLRSLVLKGGIQVSVVLGTPVAAGDGDFFSGLILDMVEEGDKYGIDKLFFIFDGQAVLEKAAAVFQGLSFVGVGGSAAPFAAEIVLGDGGRIRFGPRVGGGRVWAGSGKVVLFGVVGASDGVALGAVFIRGATGQ